MTKTIKNATSSTVSKKIATTPEKKTPAKTRVKVKAIVPSIPEPKDLYAPDFVKLAVGHVDAINKEMSCVNKSFLNIAFNLYWISENSAFKPLGYDDIYKLAADKFGIARGTTSDFINVVKKFALIENGEAKSLKPEYANYSHSKLLVMHNLDDSVLLNINPDMSVRDIKYVKKVSSPKISDSSSSSESESKPFDVESTEVRRQVMISFTTIADYEKNIDKLDEMIQRALKSPSAFQ